MFTPPEFDYERLSAQLSPVALCWLNEQGRVLFFNAAAENVFSLSNIRARGRELASLNPFGGFIWDLVRDSLDQSRALVIHDAYYDAPEGLARRYSVDVTPYDQGGCIAIRAWPTGGEKPMSENAAEAAIGFGRLLSHELKNPLAGARGAAQLMDWSQDTSDLDELRALILREIDRAKRISERWSKIGDIAPQTYEALDVHDVLHDAIQSAQASLGEGVNIAKDFDLSLPSVQGDRDLLVQAFLNLILNAGEACLEISQPSISIKTRFRTLPDGGGYPQARLAVDVIDNGPGVDPDIGASVFSPFVSTKPAGEGLGLSLVSRIAKLHDGGVEYQRYKAHTQFSFFLPV